MQITNIDIKADLESIVDIENAWCDVFISSDDGRTYIVQVITYKNFLVPEDEDPINFLSPRAPSILVKEVSTETIEAAIKYYAEKDDGYWLKFCHMGTEIDDKTLNVLTDRWFVKNNLIDFTTTNESNLMVETESLSTLKAKLKSEVKEELLIEIENSTLEFSKDFSLKVTKKYLDFSKVLIGITTLLLASQILAIVSK